MQGRFEKRGDVGIIWINNPPVNAISVGVRTAIIDGVTKLAQDPEIKVGVLACEGRTFMAGADITEFGKPPVPPSLECKPLAFQAARPKSRNGLALSMAQNRRLPRRRVRRAARLILVLT